VGDFLTALEQELYLRAQCPPFAGRAFSTLYFGGGTPSLLRPQWVGAIISKVGATFGLLPAAEVSLEANPATLSLAQLRDLRKAGITRLSVGVQSLQEKELRTLGRLHTARQAKDTFDAARKAGFDNVGIDLIFAIPGQTTATWKETLREILAWQPEHISVYALTLEDDTPMARAVASGSLSQVNPSVEASMFLLAHELLTAGGYEHYEISNYALPGRRCRHNELYWRRHPYLGFGPSAHSFSGRERWWNHPNLRTYCRALSQGILPVAGNETLSREQEDLERIMLGLRTAEGCDMRTCRRPLTSRFRERVGSLPCTGGQPIVIIEGDSIRLTPQGFLLHEEVCRLLA